MEPFENDDYVDDLIKDHSLFEGISCGKNNVFLLKNNVEILKKYINSYDINVNDKCGDTPLILIAILCGYNINYIKALLEAGANIYAPANSYSKDTILEFVLKTDYIHDDYKKLLIDKNVLSNIMKDSGFRKKSKSNRRKSYKKKSNKRKSYKKKSNNNK